MLVMFWFPDGTTGYDISFFSPLEAYVALSDIIKTNPLGGRSFQVDLA
jgi:hypothetical protein